MRWEACRKVSFVGRGLLRLICGICRGDGGEGGFEMEQEYGLEKW